MVDTGFIASVKRGVRQLAERRLYFFAMIVIPLGVLFFLTGLMDDGLPMHIPTAVVDLDNTVETREIIRNLDSSAEVDVTYKLNSYAEAMQLVREGKIYGFFLIPYEFTHDALSGRQPQIAYYTNSTFYIPASLLYRSLKTTSVLASAAMVKAYLVSGGATDQQVQTLLQPVQLMTNQVHNPWANYSIYLGNSFIPCSLALMILLVTAFSIWHEEKRGTTCEWLAVAHGSMLMALLGKLLPQTLVFTAVGVFIQSYLFGFLHFPLHCSVWTMVATMLLFVLANQSFAVFVSGAMPNLRLSLSICSLVGVLSFSVGAFSFPLEAMYGSIGVFSYIIPVRYYFLIYVDQALNGFPIYYSRYYFVALLIFLLLPVLVLKRMKKAAMNPVYVP